MATLAFIGLGNMGYPMAGHLANRGHELRIYNRTQEKQRQWLSEFRGLGFPDIATTVSDCDAVILCVGRDDDVRDLLTGQHKAMAAMRPGTLIIDHTTTSAALAEEMASVAQQSGLRFADAPVSGGQQGAINGQLSLMVGCQEDDYREIQQLTSPYTRKIERMGDIGAGQKTKMVNQICVAGLIQALAEGLHFAEQAGLDRSKVMSVISQGAAGSWQMSNRHQTMINGEYHHGFAIDWMRKDLDICLQEAQLNGSDIPVTRLVNEYYRELQSMGAGRLDTSALLLRLQQQKN
ncbi:MAG: NAD(P)-dependent oxidoreductase [Saccharospirillaceae bacterium]|nr:NAD(P)-dependent oxidoreductase [Saccharospirillaceae bacterium]MCD8532792.1 NAD(P)-dependent oxidoreductase [Saccharospirillaceae bacterium]